MNTRNRTIRPKAGRGPLAVLALAVTVSIMLASGVAAAKAVPTEVAVGKSIIISLPVSVKTVSLTDPSVADVVAVNPKELQINGKKIGSTSMIVWDSAGNKTFFDLSVVVDLTAVKAKISEIAPGDDVRYQMINNDTLIVTGSVSTEERWTKIHNLLLGFGTDITEKELVVMQGGVTREVRTVAGEGKGFKFVMLLEVSAPQQVLLQVTVASVDRKAIGELGINWAYGMNKAIGAFSGVGGITAGSAILQGSPLQFTPFGATQSTSETTGGPQFGVIDPHNNAAYFLKALSGKGLAKILAEPNLLVKSGSTGTFLAGGEVPFPVAQAQTIGTGASNTITIEYKEFGVRLNITPIVRENGLIQLGLGAPAETKNIVQEGGVTQVQVEEKAGIEVSSLDFATGIREFGFNIPLIKRDFVSTSVDLRDGEMFIIAGLMQDDWDKTLDKIPVLGDIPVLGAFFRDQKMHKEERELVFLITPRITRPMAAGQKPELPGANEPNADQQRDLKWVPLMPTKRSTDPEKLK